MAYDRDPAPDADDDAFLQRVRAFLDRALTPDLREAGRRTLGVHSDIAAGRIWHRRLFNQGWIAPAWPTRWGGAGWTARRKFLFDRECALSDAPVLFAGGLRSLGPLLIEAGSPDQRSRYLPAILSGDDLWGQAFSEPGAGSDLARVSTRAVREGDDYVIDGAKIWTTGAHIANRLFALVRTADGARPQEGLTFLLIDLPAPGLTISPIITIDGEHELNALFFDGVRVPVVNRVGEEGEGWAVAKRLMALARSNNTPSALVRRVYQRARAAAMEADIEPALRRRLVEAELELVAFEQTELAALPDGLPRPGDMTAPSILKLIGSELHQKVAELAMEICGPFRGPALVAALDEDEDNVSVGARATAKHLATRAASIYSGTSETHRNVIAGALLRA